MNLTAYTSARAAANALEYATDADLNTLDTLISEADALGVSYLAGLHTGSLRAGVAAERAARAAAAAQLEADTAAHGGDVLAALLSRI
jgi:hypothetical protein